MVEFRDIEVYFLDLSVAHSGLQVTPYWSRITDVRVLETPCEFRVEIMSGPGGYWLGLYNEACKEKVPIAKVEVKGQKEV